MLQRLRLWMIWGFPLNVVPNSVSMTTYEPWPSFNDKSWTPYPDLNDKTWTPYPYFNDKSWTPYPSFSDNRHEDFQEKGEKRGKSTFLKIFIMFIVILRWFYIIYLKMSRQCRVPLSQAEQKSIPKRHYSPYFF